MNKQKQNTEKQQWKKGKITVTVISNKPSKEAIANFNTMFNRLYCSK